MLQLVLLAALSVATVLGPLLCRRDLAGQASVIAVTLFAVLVHTEYSEEARSLSLAVSAVALLTGLYRSRGTAPGKAPRPIILFVSLLTVMMIAHTTSVPRVAQYVVLGVVYLLYSAAVARAWQHRDRVLAAVTVPLVLIQALVSIADIHFGIDNPWPRRDGETFRQIGLNNILPALGGRAMGTTGYSITLGLLSALLLLACLYLGFQQRRRLALWLVLAAICAYLIVLSGTRTALVMLAGAAVIWVVRSFRVSLALIYLSGGLLLVAVIDPARTAIMEWLGVGQGLEDSASYLHRTNILQSAPELFNRDPLAVVFGEGPGFVEQALRQGIVVGYQNISVFDNDYLRLFASYGLVVAIAFTTVLATAILGRGRFSAASAAALAVGASTFDLTTWHSLTILMILFVSFERARLQTREMNTEHGEGAALHAMGRVRAIGRSRAMPTFVKPNRQAHP